MVKTIDISTVAKDSIKDFSSWEENQDFDYHRMESAVIDYVNIFIDYAELEAAIEDSDRPDLEGWETLFDKLGFEQDSDKSQAAKNHIESVISAKTQ